MTEQFSDSGKQDREPVAHNIPLAEQVVIDSITGDRFISVTFRDRRAGMDIAVLSGGRYTIENVYVHESEQGKGSGTALFQWAKDYVEQRPDAKSIEALLINDVSEHIARKVFGDQSVHYVFSNPLGREPGDPDYSPEIEVGLLYALDHENDA